MVETRQEAKAAFDHILDNVLNRYGSEELKKALINEGLEDVFFLMSIDDNTIDALEYPDPLDATRTIPVRKGDKSVLKLWREYVLHRIETENPVGDNWLNVTQAKFDAYRIDPTNIARLSATGGTGSTALVQTTANAPTLASTFTMVELFCKGIKRDPSLFPTLKDEKFNDSWHRSFMTQA